MDFDPRVVTDDGSGYDGAFGLCNFHYGPAPGADYDGAGYRKFEYGTAPDSFADPVKTEKICVEVLNRLNTQADEDIKDLEDQLAIIRCQRKWAEVTEEKDPYEVSCATFQRKIDSLTSTIQRLKNGDLEPGTQRPAERICEIIDALINCNFTEPNEKLQVEDLDKEKNQLVSPGSADIDTTVRQHDTTEESSPEYERQRLSFKKLGERIQTFSEESSSEAARYTNMELTEINGLGASAVDISKNFENAGSASEGKIKDLTEINGLGASNVNDPEKMENTRTASEAKSGFLTSLDTVTSQIPYQASDDEGNSKVSASQHLQTENCMEVLDTGGSSSTLLAVNTEEIVMDDQGHHTSMHDPTGSGSMVQEHTQKDSVEDCMTPANPTPSVADHQTTSGRQGSSLRSILKPTGQQVQRKILGAGRQVNPRLMLRPEKENKKRKTLSSVENIGQSPSPSSDVEGGNSSFLDTNLRQKLGSEEDPPKIPEIKINQPEGASSMLSSSAVVKSPDITSESANPGTRKTVISTLDVWNPEEPFTNNVMNLKQKLSEEPDYFTKQTVPKLREVVKLCKIRGVTKLKKEQIIQGLTRYLSEISFPHVFTDSVSNRHDVEGKDPAESRQATANQSPSGISIYHVPIDSALRTENLEIKDLPGGQLAIANHTPHSTKYIIPKLHIPKSIEPDCFPKPQSLEGKDPTKGLKVPACPSPSETNIQVSTDPIPQPQNLEGQDPAEALAAIAAYQSPPETNIQHVFTDPVSGTQDREVKYPAEGELAIAAQSQSVADQSQEKEETAQVTENTK